VQEKIFIFHVDLFFSLIFHLFTKIFFPQRKQSTFINNHYNETLSKQKNIYKFNV